ncbi:hypothetical protein HELRODRAFT_96778 [Helobdella robusta]|uniref:carbonic anhydrase n=1 Tax=Helobdella robusta TaxID=6412 RepID=T1G9D7_HELRO|nr:hypothetical protein HELRODRAFT_96778 [Helobdella robusta]ESO11605.1 hypothetical protein HELRODRAFT_96778 [Helobdella robusta]
MELGPSHWPEISMVCNGTRQSPINISKSTTNNSLDDFVFHNYNATPLVTTVTYNGHTGQFQVTVPSDTLMIHGGGLNDIYNLAQFHFHWGSNDSYGSEHLDHGKAYPGEIHFVHWHSGKYSNLNESFKHDDGVAVLGVFIDVVQDANDPRISKDLAKLTDYFVNIKFPGNQTNCAPFTLASLLPKNLTYYRYLGSLTTPDCSEIVTWTVYQSPIYITSDQMAKFRHFHRMEHLDEDLDHTNRPVQPLYNREVYNSPTSFSSSSSSSSFFSSPSPLSAFVFFRAGIQGQCVKMMMALVFTSISFHSFFQCEINC